MKKSNIIKLLFILGMLFLLTSCSCGCSCQSKYMNESDVKSSLNEIISLGNEENSARRDQTINYVSSCAQSVRSNFINTYLDAVVEGAFIITVDETATIDQVSSIIGNQLNDELNNLNTTYNKKAELSPETLPITDYISEKTQEVKSLTLLNDLYSTSSKLVDSIISDSDFEDYQIVLFAQHRIEAQEKIDAISRVITSEDTTEKTYDVVLVERATEMETIVVNLQAQLAADTSQPEPIRFQVTKDGKFDFGVLIVNFFDNFFIYPVGWLLQLFTKICGGFYIFGLIITTLLIRTIAWPIYAKSNDMTLKMKLMEPEQAKIQEKYSRRKDPESQKMMQMELMQLYKKYGVGIGGCIMPLLQLPIFLAVFRAVTRIPYTNGTVGSPNWVSSMNSTFLGIDLFADKSAGTWQFIAIIILCILVGGTQILQQVFMNLRNKKQQEESQKDIPAYRRQAVAQGQQNNSMKIFMWVMVGMMVVFVFTSKAGLGIYWLIGNLYALFQSYIGSKTSDKRMEKLRNKAMRR